MFKWPMLAAATVGVGLLPTSATARQEIETVVAIPSQ
jgi:hypothetical protein